MVCFGRMALSASGAGQRGSQGLEGEGCWTYMEGAVARDCVEVFGRIKLLLQADFELTSTGSDYSSISLACPSLPAEPIKLPSTLPGPSSAS